MQVINNICNILNDEGFFSFLIFRSKDEGGIQKTQFTKIHVLHTVSGSISGKNLYFCKLLCLCHKQWSEKKNKNIDI